MDDSLFRGVKSKKLLAHEALSDDMSFTISPGDTVIFELENRNPAVGGVFMFETYYGNLFG